MSPQPTAPPAPTTGTEATGNGKADEKPSLFEVISAKAEGDRTPGERQILRAHVLEAERSELMGRIDANRKYLRLMAQNEELTEAEVTFLDTFYPEKEKGERRSEDQIEATRKAREAARTVAKKAAKKA